MHKITRFSLVAMLMSGPLWAQVTPSTGQQIDASYQLREQLAQSSILKDYPVRSIGPVVQGGRVSDLAVTTNPAHYYVIWL